MLILKNITKSFGTYNSPMEKEFTERVEKKTDSFLFDGKTFIL